MLTIRQLGRRFGLSRATLLYYDRIGLLHPSARSEAGYRLYDADAAARLGDICVYSNAGLSLEAVKRLLDGPQTAETGILTARMRELDAQIERLRAQQQAIAELIARGDGHPASAPFDKSCLGRDPCRRRHGRSADGRLAPGLRGQRARGASRLSALARHRRGRDRRICATWRAPERRLARPSSPPAER